MDKIAASAALKIGSGSPPHGDKMTKKIDHVAATRFPENTGFRILDQRSRRHHLTPPYIHAQKKTRWLSAMHHFRLEK